MKRGDGVGEAAGGWGLEVVRGREVGRVFPVGPGASLVVGGAPGAGLDLGGQETSTTRRMAARQARLDCGPGGLAVADLDSPGGTFVNRQRVLPGSLMPLRVNDVLQLAGVHLRVVPPPPAAAISPAPAPVPLAARPPAAPTAPPTARTPAPKPAAAGRPTPTPASPVAPPPPVKPTPAPESRPGPLPTPFRLASGLTCRSWDDFLTASAQGWGALREELTSGRLAKFLAGVGRSDLLPGTAAGPDADERLDAWLGRLPALRAAEPGLDVQPSVVRFKAVPGGGETAGALQVTSTGYRLLRSTVRVEPPTADWLRVARGPYVTAESTVVPFQVTLPESLGAPLSATLVLESNGGSARVEVRVEPVVRTADPVPAGAVAGGGVGLGDRLAGVPATARVAGFALAGALVRAAVAAGAGVGGLLGATTGERPGLAGAAVMLAAAGAAAAAWLARGDRRDWPYAATAGAGAGVLAASLAVAACRAVEPVFGRLAESTPLAVALWAALGLAAGAASVFTFPYRPAAGGATR